MANLVDRFLDRFKFKDFLMIIVIVLSLFSLMFLKVHYCVECALLEKEKDELLSENSKYQEESRRAKVLIANIKSPENIRKKIQEKTNLIMPTKNNFIIITKE